MGLISCPECGTKISDRATQCPNCGFCSDDPTRPISEQDKFEMVPTFEYDIEGWQPNRNELSVISYEENKSFIEYFGQWKIIQNSLPAIAEVIASMAKKDHVMVAKLDPYVKELIAKGLYRFSIDKNGEILPTIRDGQKIVKQVRLEEMKLSPELTRSLNDLSVHAAMALIIDKIECVGDAIRELHIELQNDRLAMAEAARDKLKQAIKIQDSRKREMALLSVISSATDAKRVLMRSFSQNLFLVIKHSGDVRKKKDPSKNATDALQAIIAITNSVQIECEGYAVLGEYESCRECLVEFNKFIIDNKLNDRDTLLLLNENAPENKIDIVDKFANISSRIASFSDPLTANDKNGEDNNE